MPLELGVCDYPEHIGFEEWAVFPKKMRELGLTYVRIGEFAWSKLEPSAGNYQFAWLDAAIKALHQEGLRVVLGTPTATPPAWLVRAHPEILPVDVVVGPCRRAIAPASARLRSGGRRGRRGS